MTCPLCDGTGYKDYAGFAMDPCDHEERNMTHFIYRIGPIDAGWDYLPTVEEVAKKVAIENIADATSKDPLHYESYENFDKFMDAFRSAKSIAKCTGWEGDYRLYEGPRVFFLPSESTFEYGFVWKQDNNGSTFVISPIELPHLMRIAV